MELNDLAPAVIILVAIGILLGIGIYTIAEVRTEVATDYAGADNSVNLTSAAGTTTLTDSTKDDYAVSAVTAVNGSAVTIPTTYYNYTTAGVVSWAEALYNGSTAYYASNNNGVNVTSTFTYDKADSAEEGLGDVMDGLAGFSGWIAVIVLVIAASVVLGVVLRSFGQKTMNV